MDANKQISIALQLPTTRKTTADNPRTVSGLHTLVTSRSPRNPSQPLLSLSPLPQICSLFPRQWQYDTRDESGGWGGEQREQRRGSCQRHMECLVFAPAHNGSLDQCGSGISRNLWCVLGPSEHIRVRTATRRSQLDLHCLQCSAKSSDYWVRKWHDCICHLKKNLIKKCTLKNQHCFLSL